MDLDGDGTAEVLRELQAGGTRVTSPTMNGTILTNVPVNQAGAVPNTVKWFLDWNGDGLMDLAYVDATSDPARIVTMVNIGKGLFVQATTTLSPSVAIGQGWRDMFDSGVRVADINLDGRDDLVLVDNGATSAGPQRSNVVVLLSDGTGKFNPVVTSIPIGDPADGYRPSSPPSGASGDHGYRTSVVMDVNGDGMPDVLQLEGGRLIGYLHQGNQPDMVNQIVEGTERVVSVSYAPLSDTTTYTAEPPGVQVDPFGGAIATGCPIYPGYYGCLVRGRTLAKSLTISGGSISETRTFTYTNGVMDQGGRGFVGFQQVDTYGPDSRHVTKSFDAGAFKTVNDTFNARSYYVYPYGFRPRQILTQLDTPQGPQSHHITYEFLHYDFEQPFSWGYTVWPQTSQQDIYDCQPASSTTGTICASGTGRLLGKTLKTTTFDAYGNLTSNVVDHYDQSNTVVQTEKVTTTYYAPDLADWLIRMPQQRITTGSTPNESVVRTTNFTPDLSMNAVTGYPSGVLNIVEIEPSGDASTHLLRTLGRDTRGRLISVKEAGYPTPGDCGASCGSSCNGSCQAQCATSSNPAQCMSGCMAGCMGSCSPTCLATPLPARETIYKYEDADGVYVSSTIDGMGNTTRVFRDPGFGFTVESDDPNGAASTSTYDTFGRLVGTTAQDGASVTVDYSPGDSQPAGTSGASLKVNPEGNPTRGIVVYVDPFGNETSRFAPIDAGTTLVSSTYFDPMGRPTIKQISSLTSAGYTSLNIDSTAYDDMGRVLSDCHLTSADDQQHCRTNSYDGLTTVAIDESGRNTTTIKDALGRISIERAVVPNPTNQFVTSDATFTYGPFGQLEHEKTSDDVGETDIMYDVLGRPTSLVRAGVWMPLVFGYDAFGEVTSKYKLNPNTGAHVETQTMAYDKAGRLISQKSPGFTPGPGVPPALDRHFYYDNKADGTPAPNGKGHLVDVVDAGFRVSLHFDYDASGRTAQKTWTIFNPALNQTESWAVTINAYDSQGRIDTMTYPQVPGEAAPLAVQYEYDPYLGTTSTIKDAGTGSTIWSATAHNERGEITNESMSFGTTAIARVTSYYLQDGRVKDTTLSSNAPGNPQANVSYTYHADGLPLSIGMSGVGGSWTSLFDYDNLRRLTYWSPAPGAYLTYGYDSDGNLATRNWSSAAGSASVVYGSTAPDVGGGSIRTISGSGTGVTAITDSYKVDGFGRIWDTPAVSIWNTDDDKVGSITEKATGQVDTLIYDGLSERVLTLYGTNGSAGTLITLGDLFELKRDASGIEGRCRLRADDQLVGDIVRQGTAARAATFYLTDNVGSVVAEASQDGTVTARARRDPFGNLLSDATTPNLPPEPTGADPDGSSRLGFAMHERDPNWGLVDMVKRAYSPRLGRFIYPDFILPSMLDRRNHNPFAYARNLPTAANDPSGLDAESDQEAAEAAARAAAQGAAADAEARAAQEAAEAAEQAAEEEAAEAAAAAAEEAAQQRALQSHSYYQDDFGHWYLTPPGVDEYETTVKAPLPDWVDWSQRWSPATGFGQGPPPAGATGLGGGEPESARSQEGHSEAGEKVFRNLEFSEKVTEAAAKYGEVTKGLGEELSKDANGAIADIETGEKMVNVGGKVAAAATVAGGVLGVAQFAVGVHNDNPVQKLTGAFGVGVAAAGLIVGGPAVALVGLGVAAFEFFF